MSYNPRLTEYRIFSLNVGQIINVDCQHSYLLWFLFGNSDESQGQGQLLIQTVKLAFSVTNNVIRLKPPSSVVSPLEQALTQHGMYFSLGAAWEAMLFCYLQIVSVSYYKQYLRFQGSKKWFLVMAEGLFSLL